MINEYFFKRFIPRGFESEVLFFKKERIIRSKERKGYVLDHFANQKVAFSEGRSIVI